jgi:alkaline phosphatase
MNQWAAYKTAHEGRCPAADIDQEMIDLMETTFGLNYSELNDYQKEKLEDAYDMSLCGSNDNSVDENKFLYGGYNPIIVTITHILNERASIGWTSYSHTGVPVPVFAEGREAFRFAGFYDNTDIAKKLARAMGIRAELPVTKY